MKQDSKVAANYKAVNEYNKLVHRVFVQTEDGKKLLAIWTDHLVSSDGDVNGRDLYSLGVTEGLNRFVRKIKANIIQAEGEK